MKRPNAKRVLIIGSGGRVGQSLLRALAHQHEVIGLERRQLDLASPKWIEAELDKLEFDHVFITGALTGVDYCEAHPAEAYAVNASAPGAIAKYSLRKNAHVTYLSTDLVFDGEKNTAYTETDDPSPISIYGASKLKGEEEVLAASEKNLVIRISWVFGPTRPAFPEWIIRRACQETDLALPTDKISCPTYTPDLVGWIESLALNPKRPSAGGIFHLCNPESCSWRDWGQTCIDCARAIGVPVVTNQIRGVPLSSVASFIARRPPNSALNINKFQVYAQTEPRHWGDALADFLVQNRSNLLYPSGAVSS